jgi:translation initiation factor eIF-2B subunit beta
MFSLLSHPEQDNSLPSTPGTQSPRGVSRHGPSKDVRAEVLEGINEIIDELDQVDDQISSYALEHIHSNEIILTHTSSTTVQKFLIKAASKRKFTVIHAESFPNNHDATHAAISGKSPADEENLSFEAFQKPLIALGITVILIPDSAVFALMSRVNKVILGTHSVLANGGLVAAAGTRVIARAAKVHQTPVVVVSGVYKLSPVYPFDFDSLIEYGDASKVLPYEDGDLVDQIDVQNPLYDYVPAELVDLYITNLYVSSHGSLSAYFADILFAVVAMPRLISTALCPITTGRKILAFKDLVEEKLKWLLHYTRGTSAMIVMRESYRVSLGSKDRHEIKIFEIQFHCSPASMDSWLFICSR